MREPRREPVKKFEANPMKIVWIYVDTSKEVIGAT
jgi:hypothetical protein